VEELGPRLPLVLEELSGCETLLGLQAPGMGIGVPEELEVAPVLLVAAVVIAFGGRVIEGAVHPLNLAVRRADSSLDCHLVLLTPGMVRLG
jgi:hypothetical protein